MKRLIHINPDFKANIRYHQRCGRSPSRFWSRRCVCNPRASAGGRHVCAALQGLCSLYHTHLEGLTAVQGNHGTIPVACLGGHHCHLYAGDISVGILRSADAAPFDW